MSERSTCTPLRRLPLVDPERAHAAPATSLSVGFVIPFGEPVEGYFPDTLLELCCARARELGHRAALVRVYYDGRDDERDAAVRDALAGWLEERAVDLVVAERMFDPAPVRAHLARAPGRRAALVSWGDGDAIEGFDLVIGRTAGRTRNARTRRSPSAGELVRAFEGVLRALASGEDPAMVPGVARVVDGALVAGPEASPEPLPRPFRPALDHDVIAPGAAPPITRKYLFGNAGCPFADDPAENPHYVGLDLRATPTLARLGCAFCQAGGDYQKRPDPEVVGELLEQAAFYHDRLPLLRDLVIVDQHAPRFLAELLRAARARGLRPLRWLFSARADAFVREEGRVREAIAAAAEGGHALELYLSGFEAFCDRELTRYNKGADVATLLRAVRTMRALAREHPGTFDHARARGHSLILWSPWTSTEDLHETTANIRQHGLLDLFEDIGRNRLRLYEDLPITLAAARDGALTDAWDEGDEGAARRKGYAVERPWRFLDARTRLAFAIARGLRQRLGAATEVAQIEAAARFAGRSAASGEAIPALAARALADVDHLARALAALADGRGRAPHLASTRAHPALLGGACNNGCPTCANRDRYLDDDERAALARIDAARTAGGPIVLAGREPLLHPAFLRLVERARGADHRSVGVVTNGRRLAYRPFTISAVRAGLRAASVKLFAAEAATADAVSLDAGGHAQALAGLAELRRAGVTAFELRVPLHHLALRALEASADLAARAGARGIRVEAALDAIGLDHAAEAITALARLEDRCAALGVPLAASRLEAGTRAFDALPRGRPG